MKKMILAITASALALSGTAAHAKLSYAEKGEARLTKILDGREAGKPVSCITTLRDNGMEVIDHTAIVYDAGKVIYVARPTHPRSLGRSDVLVIKRHSPSRLCTNDSMHTADQTSGFTTSVVFLQKFVPYTKVDEG